MSATPSYIKADAQKIMSIKAHYDLRDIAAPSLTSPREIGDSLIANCLFHNDKTPSLRVYKDRFHCFGCSASGDIFDWLMRTRGLTFPQAIQALMSNHIKDLPSDRAQNRRRKEIYSEFEARERRDIIEANECAGRYFRAIIDCPDEVTEYMTDRFAEASIEKFDLGYCPLDSSDFIDYMTGECGVPRELMIKAGILGTTSTGVQYSRLRGRIIFPLTNKVGDILGFSGRATPITPADAPKYIHPPSTKAYRRNDYIYGWQTFNAEYPTITLVEGAVDVISLDSIGAKNIFSIFGSNIGQNQINMLKHVDKPITIMMDGDPAGLNAAFEIARKLYDMDSVFLRLLGDGLDPDSIVAKGLGKGYILSCPKINNLDFLRGQIVSNEIKPEYDASLLHKLVAPYVQDNVNQGWPHYNVVDWVCQAYPVYAQEIKETLYSMINDYIELPNGKRGLKEERVKAFIKAWMRPSKEVRRQHDNQFKI